MRPGFIITLLVACAAAAHGRELQQTESTTCPIQYCLRTARACVLNGIPQKWTCNQCESPRVPNTLKTACVCPAGYYPNSNGGCTLCKKNFYCPRGQVADRSTAVRCPRNMLTSKPGAKSIEDCVNAPGYYYKKSSSTYLALPCPPNTYSLGLEKQTACNQCPADYVTDPDLVPGAMVSASFCVAPPGYFIDGAEVVPCPKGSFSSSYNANWDCTTCASLFGASGTGVTTVNTGSTSADNCIATEPGYILIKDDKTVITTQVVLANINLGGAKLCPQNYYCPGGDQTVAAPGNLPVQCPNGLWTQGEGASSVYECVTPPGMYMPTPAATITDCPSGTFKDNWDLANITYGCTPCGLGKWESDQTIFLNRLDANTGLVAQQVKVRGAASSCFIQQGMGAVAGPNATNPLLLADFCPPNFYGVAAAKKYGRVATMCVACPANMKTGTSATPNAFRAGTWSKAGVNTNNDLASTAADSTGYYSVQACLTQPGYGYYSGASQVCPQGTFNAGNNRLPCQACPYGTTTVGTTNDVVADCSKYIPGFGFLYNNIAPCQIGFYSDGTGAPNASCTACSANKWTPTEGAVLDGPTAGNFTYSGQPGCTLCAPGYGDEVIQPVNSTTAPTCTACPSGYYGPASRDTTPCLACPVTRTFTYNWDVENTPIVDPFTPLAITPFNGVVNGSAKSVDECVVEFAQIIDESFYLDLVNGTVNATTAENLATCVQQCKDYATGSKTCIAVTFNYASLRCQLLTITVTANGAGGIALKTLPSLLIPDGLPLAKAYGAGYYSFYRLTDADAVATVEAHFASGVASGVSTSMGACLDSCNKLDACVGVTFTTPSGGNCKTISGIVDPGLPQRSLTRAMADKLQYTAV